MDLPVDLRTAFNLDDPVVFVEVETVVGTYFSFLTMIEVALEEQTPASINSPLTLVWAWRALEWVPRDTLAPSTGTPVTLWTSPCSTRSSHTQRLQSSLGWPSSHTSWHLAVVTQCNVMKDTIIQTQQHTCGDCGFYYQDMVSFHTSVLQQSGQCTEQRLRFLHRCVFWFFDLHRRSPCTSPSDPMDSIWLNHTQFHKMVRNLAIIYYI